MIEKKKKEEEEMKKEKEEKRFPVAIIFIAGVIFLLGLGGALLLLSPGIQGRIVGGGAIAVALFLIVTTVHRISFPEVWIVDRLGTLIEKNPGYRLIVKFFGIEKVYKKVKAKIQYEISLFPDRKDIQIDLRKGGRFILKDPRIWIVVNEPLKAVKKAVNFEEQLREIAEHRLTGTINSLTYEEVMEMKTPKMLEGKGILEKIDEVIEKSEGLKKFREECGIEYKGFTLDDFDFDESTTKKREERILTEMGKEIAQNISEARKSEMSAIAQTAKVLQEAGFSPSLAQETASERYQDHLVGEKGSLQKIIWTGGGNSIPELSSQWELGKKLLGKEEPKKEEKAEEVKAEEIKKPLSPEKEEMKETKKEQVGTKKREKIKDVGYTTLGILFFLCFFSLIWRIVLFVVKGG